MHSTAAQLETASTSRSAHLKEIFQSAVTRSFSSYHVEMTAAEAEGASGLRERRQICLVSNAGLFLVIGFVDPGRKTGELHTLGSILVRSKERFGVELVIPPLEYQAFLKLARQVLEGFGLSVTVIAAR